MKLFFSVCPNDKYAIHVTITGVSPLRSLVLYDKCPYFSTICVLPPSLQLSAILVWTFIPFFCLLGSWVLTTYIHTLNRHKCIFVCSWMREKSRPMSRNVCTYSLIFSLALLPIINYTHFLKLNSKSYCQNLRGRDKLGRKSKHPPDLPTHSYNCVPNSNFISLNVYWLHFIDYSSNSHGFSVTGWK